MKRLIMYLLVFFIAMLPIIELRGPVIASGFGEEFFNIDISPLHVLPIAVLGNMVPVPFIIRFFNFFFNKFRNVRFIGTILTKVHNKAVKHADKINKYVVWGVFIFVAIPLPGTGAWTGSVIATVLEMKPLKATLTILAGVVCSGLILAFFSFGLLDVIISLF